MMLYNDNTYLDPGQLNQVYQRYLELFEPTTDAPPEFLFSALLPALGAAISMNRWIEWGTKRIYPNIWVILVAQSTSMRKSTSLEIGASFLRQLGLEEGRSLILPNDGSIAGFIPELQAEKHGLVKHSELASLFDNMRKGYNINMKSLFTDFFDVPHAHRIVLAGESIIVNYPIFGLSSASTLNWLKQKTSINDFESGFMARFLFCMVDMKTKILPIPAKPDEQQCADMKAAFEKMLKLEKKPIRFDEGWKQVFCENYEAIENINRDVLTNDSIKAQLGRLQTDYFLKFSILECVFSKTTVADEAIARRVQYLVDFYMSNAQRVIHATQRTKRSEQENKVLQYIKKKGLVTRTEMHNIFQRNQHVDNIEAILKPLMDANLIAKTKHNRSWVYSLVEIREPQTAQVPVGQEISPEFVNS